MDWAVLALIVVGPFAVTGLLFGAITLSQYMTNFLLSVYTGENL
jgi:hypothetical protein